MYLNIGSGAYGLPGFINGDIAPFAGKNGIQFVDIEKPWPYPTFSAEMVLMSHVLCLREPRERILREAYRVLKPGGWFRIDDNPNRFWSRESEIDCGFPAHLLMSRTDLVQLLSNVGFRKVCSVSPEDTLITAELRRVILSNKGSHESFTLEAQK